MASVAGGYAVTGFCVYLERLDFLKDRSHVLRETEEPGPNVSSPTSNLISSKPKFLSFPNLFFPLLSLSLISGNYSFCCSGLKSRSYSDKFQSPLWFESSDLYFVCVCGGG